MECLIIFPNQLFEIKYLQLDENISHIFIIEEPLYFGSNKRIQHFTKLKLVLHRSSMKYYENYLKKYTKIPIQYIDYKKVKKYSFLEKYNSIHLFDPIDHLLLKQLQNKFKNKLIIYDNPNFLCTNQQLKDYYNDKKTKNRFFHSNFYKWQLKNYPELNIKKSYDTLNRKKLPDNIKIPKLPKNDNDTKYIKEAKIYVNKHFKNNYGNVDDFIFPITHKTSKKWLKSFIKHKLHNFGTYQDAITDKQNDISDAFLFHSALSPMINIGLLQPSEIIDEVRKYYMKHKKTVDINNYEGYIRQIIGWREYQRFLYLYNYNDMKNSNYFGNKRKLTHVWYNGETGVLPIDNTIKKTIKYGYLHHIERLMIMSNFMNLCQIHPQQIYQWFMELFVDAYDWVMVGNVTMGTFNDGGKTMRKPYISSDNYIMNMSNYSKGDWNKIWDDLFYYFLDTHQKQLKKTIYVRNLYYWKKRKDKNDVRKNAKSFLKKKA